MARASQGTEKASLRFRGTFLDVSFGGPARGRRARSATPAPRDACYGDFEPEHGYVQDLWDRLAVVTDAGSATAFFATPTSDKGAQLPGKDVSSLSTAAPQDSLSRSSSRSGGEVLGLGPPGYFAPSADTAARRPDAALGGSALNSNLAGSILRAKAGHFDGAEAYRAVEPARSPPAASVGSWGAPCSRGSIGHPELCNRACLYFPSGMCGHGEECEYCHMEHPKRTAHLDKRHREMLRNLSRADWAGLVFPILKRKVCSLDASGLGLAMISEMASMTKLSMEDIGEYSPQRHQRMLVLTLRAMNLKTLLATVQRGLTLEGEALDGLCRALTQHLRQLAVQEAERQQFANLMGSGC